MRARAAVATAMIAAAACGPAPPPTPALANQAAPPPRPVCSDARVAELARELRARWGAEDELVLRCVPGMFPAAGLFIEAVSRAADPAVHRTGIISADGRTEIAPFRDVRMLPVATSIVDYATADLDLDGIDEIVETWTKRAHGMMGSETWLVLRRLEARRLEPIRGPHLDIFFPELGACDARLELARGVLVVVVTGLRGIPPSDCLAPGTHTFVLRGGELVEKR